MEKEKLELHHSLGTAFEVFNKINELINVDLKESSIWVEAFDNCREQGLVIKIYTEKLYNIAIVTHRNSDQIRLWMYDKTKYPSNLMAEDAEIEEEVFKEEDITRAAEYIIKLIKNKIN